MGKLSRSKGRRGETAAKRLLLDHDWEIIADTTGGLSTEDLICCDPHGQFYSVEVKNTKLINIPLFKKQSMANCKKLHWLLLMKIDSTRSWLVMGKNRPAAVWHEKVSE